MTMKAKMASLLATLTLSALRVVFADPASRPDDPVVVLDLNEAMFRVFYGWKTPRLIAPDGRLKPLLERQRNDPRDGERRPAPQLASAAPAANWMAPEFDDSAWPKLEINHPAWRPKLLWAALNARGLPTDGKYLPCGPLEGNIVCLRGTFVISDPAQVKEMKLQLGYFGGAVVYVNGIELRRGHLPAGRLDADTLATRYPDEAYLVTNNTMRSYAGNWIFGYWNDVRIHTNMLNGMKVWRRELTAEGEGTASGVRIPPAMLRKGVNTLAIAVHAAPVNELFYEKSIGGVTWSGSSAAPWPHAMVVDARLTAATGAGLEEDGGIMVVTGTALQTVPKNELLPPAPRIQPIRLAGARNGSFSGKAIVASSSAITNLTAKVSDLKLAGRRGRIAAADIQLRWADYATPETSWRNHFDRLRDDFPATAQALPAGGRRQALVPVWVTVHVPAAAIAGNYSGTLKMEVAQTPPASFTVPVQLKVHDWRMPDPQDFAIHNNIYQSPDSVARYYGVPLWSERHFALIGKSLAAFRQAGSKLCIVNLLADSYTLGNSEGMVRWVRQPDGGYKYDFSIAEKYMDLYGKIAGKPGVLRLDAWQRTSDAKRGVGKVTQSVTVLDPATGKLEAMPQPPYGTPESEAFWRPVLTELRQRLEKRGWLDVAAFAWVHYSKPADPPMVDVFHRIWPDGMWMHTAHTFPSSYAGSVKGVSMPVLCSEGVWGVGALYDPDGLMGRQAAYQEEGVPHYPRRWKNGPRNVFLGFPRMGVSFVDMLGEDSLLSVYRTVVEGAIQGNVSGLGYMGGDFWPVPPVAPGAEGRRVRVSWGGQGICMSDSVMALFGPGPDGAVFTERAEMFREGVQIGEAILYLQRLHGERKLSPELEARKERLLDERARYYLRAWHNYRSFECSPWQQRDDELLALCADAALEDKRLARAVKK